MAWLEIERKAEAIMQAAERNINISESIQADLEPAWDGFCGLVRVCDDEELKERGVIRAVVRPAPAQQATQQPTAGSTSALKAAVVTPQMPPMVNNLRTGGPSNARSMSHSGSIEQAASNTPAQMQCSSQPVLIYEAAAPPLAPSILGHPAPTGDHHLQQQQQQRLQLLQPAQQKHTPAQQQQQQQQQQQEHRQALSNLAEEPTSIASCLRSLAASCAVDPLDELSEVVSGPHIGPPSWVMSYLKHQDSSDSDDNSDNSGRNDGNRHGHKSSDAADGTRATREKASTRPDVDAAAAAAAPTPAPAAHIHDSSKAEAEGAAVTAVQSVVVGAEQVAAATANSNTASHAAVHHPNLHPQEGSEYDPNRVEQLLQEALAAAEEEYQQEQLLQQRQHPDCAAAQGAAALKNREHGSPAFCRLVHLEVGEASATDDEPGLLCMENQLGGLEIAAGQTEDLINLGSSSSTGGFGDPLAAAAAGAGDGSSLDLYVETAELLDAAADAAALQVKHGAAAASTSAGLATSSITTTSEHNTYLEPAAAAAHGGVVTTGSTAADEVAELLAAAADAVALDAIYAAAGAVSPPASRAVQTAGAAGPAGPASAAGPAVTGSWGTADVGSNVSSVSGQETASVPAGHRSSSVDAEVAELLAVAADEVALQSKHSPTEAAAAAATESSDADGSDDEADRLAAAVMDADVLDAKHAAVAAAGGGSSPDKQQQTGTEVSKVSVQEDEDNASSSDSDDDGVVNSDSDSYNSDDIDEVLDLLEELPEVPSHVASVASEAAKQKQSSSSRKGSSKSGKSTGKPTSKGT